MGFARTPKRHANHVSLPDPETRGLRTPFEHRMPSGVDNAAEQPVPDAELTPHGITDAELTPHGITDAEVTPHGLDARSGCGSGPAPDSPRDTEPVDVPDAERGR